MKKSISKTHHDDIKKLKEQVLVEYIKSYDKAKRFKSQILSFLLIRELEDETFRLKRKNQKLQHEVNKYFSKLDNIYHSRTWKMLDTYKKVEEPLNNIVKKCIPLSIRKKIKSQVIATIYPKTVFSLPTKIKKDWNKYRRQDTNIDFLNFSVIAWNFRFQRPQQLAQQLAQKGNRVFYIKNEFTPGIIENGYAPFLVEKIIENVYEITLAASRNLFIYDDKPSKKDIEVIMASLKNLINSSNIINPIAKIDHPFWTSITDKLSMPIVYDCMDNHQGFTDNGSHLAALEQKLFQQSDTVLVSSHYLENIANKNKASNVILVPNAGDYQHFSRAQKTITPTPKDIKDIPAPIIGYYGAIADWFDTSILENLAKKHADKSIVLIGQVTNRKVEQLSARYPNIFLLGEKKYEELPAYLSRFDVCIIPFIINELIKATHPVKIYEYLAADKPIVTTKMPEINDLSDIVILSTASDFSKNISLALLQKNNHQRQKVANVNTWISRTNQLVDTVSKLFFPKISVIILSYNHQDLMKLSIDSVLNRSFYPNLEVVIVDNASTKKTVDLLNKYRHHPNVKLILNTVNYGFAKGNNIGLEAATGDYFILLNNDVIVTPGWLSRLVFHLRKDKIGLVGPVTNSIGNEAKINIKYDFDDHQELETKARQYTSLHWGETINQKCIAAFCWIMSKDIYKKLGGLDERYGRGMFEDDDYCKSVLASGKKILISEDVFIHHFGGASFSQIVSKEYKKLFADNKKKFEDKWHSKWTPHQYRK